MKKLPFFLFLALAAMLPSCAGKSPDTSASAEISETVSSTETAGITETTEITETENTETDTSAAATEAETTVNETETTTEKMSEKITEKATERMTDKITETVTEKITEKVTEKVTEAVTEVPVVLPAQNGTVFVNGRTGIYNYCPSVMQSGDGTRYLYYCTNKDSNKVIDYIGFRIGTPDKGGNYTYGAETLVLSPTAGSWDSVHTCDPSVIKGKFKYKGETYSYLMAYLGCSTTNNQDNKIGLAVAMTPGGPFTKVGDKPFIDFERDASADTFQWGVGQPSLVSRDKGGKVWLFYTRGDKYGTATYVEEWNLSDLGSPICERSAVKLSESGLVDLNGGADLINNADFAFDPTSKIFYASSDCHPNPSDAPDFISSDFRVTSFTGSFSVGQWKTVGQAGASATGAARNHNTGIVRSEYGHLADPRVLCVYYTVSVTGSQSLWSYRLHDYYFDLTK